jgi:hypothetical protein
VGSAAGIVSVGVAALRREPEHAAELVSQAILGETVRVEDRTTGGDWLAVRLDVDGYRGWIRSWSLVEVGREAAELWRREAGANVGRREVVVRAAPARSSAPLAVAPWQARLAVRGATARWAEVGMPGGGVGFVEHSGLVEGPAPGGPPTPRRLLRTARAMLGVPYLWGGRTAWGFDCSGFVQAVFAWHGVGLPRDAAAQFAELAQGEADAGAGGPGAATPGPAIGPPGGRAGERAGDLLFFGRTRNAVNHVALGAGGSDFLHAFGKVTLGSLDRASELYVPQLDTSLIGRCRVPGIRAGRRPGREFPLDRT